MFNKLKFRAAIIERGKTMGDVAKMLEINEATLSRKTNGVSDFSREEIQKICEYLNLESPMEIFFDNRFTQTQERRNP